MQPDFGRAAFLILYSGFEPNFDLELRLRSSRASARAAGLGRLRLCRVVGGRAGGWLGEVAVAGLVVDDFVDETVVLFGVGDQVIGRLRYAVVCPRLPSPLPSTPTIIDPDAVRSSWKARSTP